MAKPTHWIVCGFFFVYQSLRIYNRKPDVFSMEKWTNLTEIAMEKWTKSRKKQSRFGYNSVTIKN